MKVRVYRSVLGFGFVNVLDYPMENWLELAQTALQKLWGADVSATIKDSINTEGRNRVYRLAITNAPVSSLILKASVGNQENPYQVGDIRPRSAYARFCNEWAGCQMLSSVSMGAKAYAGSAEHGFFLMQDLGKGVSLADKLNSNNPQEARNALLLYAKSLGQLHAATQNQEAQWNQIRSRIGAPKAPSQLEQWATQTNQFIGICQRYGIAIPEQFAFEMNTILVALEHPKEYLVFTPTDCCPDNHLLQEDGLLFFDCEGATMRHALLDAAYLLVPFPSCWCVGQIPEHLSRELIAAYRQEFFGGSDFEDQLTLAVAYWTIQTLTWKWAGDWEKQDYPWGLVSFRQRHLYRLENLLARENLELVLPSLYQVARELHNTLQVQWADLEPMPLYPAFKSVSMLEG